MAPETLTKKFRTIADARKAIEEYIGNGASINFFNGEAYVDANEIAYGVYVYDANDNITHRGRITLYGKQGDYKIKRLTLGYTSAADEFLVIQQ